MNIAFMGSDPIALPMLDSIQSGDCPDSTITTVFTQPDRKSGRGLRLQANAIKKWAQAHELEVFQPHKCGKAEAQLIRDRGIDLLLVMAYGKILPRSILESTSNKVMNVHTSLLPRLRGASPIHTAIAVGLEQTGVSLMEIIPEMDAGPVALQQPVRIDPGLTAPELVELLATATVPMIKQGLHDLQNDRLVFNEQDPEGVTYCRIIEKSDSHLDFNRPAVELYNRIRAFQPWPGTSFPYRDIEIRILQAEVEPAESVSPIPGKVMASDNGIRIACGADLLVPEILQRPGGKAMPVQEFLRGFAIVEGDILTSREMRPLESTTPFPYRKK